MKVSTISAIAGAIGSVGSAAWAEGPGRGAYYDHMMGDYGVGYGPGFFGVGMMILFWAIIIGAAVLIVRWLMDKDRTRGSSALDILKERLARGEVDPAEYEARKKALES